MLSSVRTVHFVGIGGTAMAAVAAAMKERGFRVRGSDSNLYPPMSDFLAERQIEVMSGFTEENLAPAPDLVVIGNALSRGNPEIESVLERKLRYCSLPELVKDCFLWGKRALVVAGTHGKTTTTALLTWVFEHNGFNPGFLIGGIPSNLGQGARLTDSEWFILEGDEYDSAFFDKRSKFLHYLPEVLVINNLEFDHADIFEGLEAIQTSFKRLVQLVPRNGLLLANGDDPNLDLVLETNHCPVRSFGTGEGNELRAIRCEFGNEESRFHVHPSWFTLPLVGELNVRNALGVIACARHCGLRDDRIQSAFQTFTGIKRRMETRGQAGGVTVVDDFGHHPTAIRETLRAIRFKYPGRRLWAIFEPRSNTTRRRVFQAELAEALSFADAVVVAGVARLHQLAEHERLNPGRLTGDLQRRHIPASYLPDVEGIIGHVVTEAAPGDVVCVFSNGGFGNIHQRLLDRLAAESGIGAPASS